mmetsp:Transcript_16112/g.38282  ORF Transcript_16112/g.38282 Transcript_16112/m.38282 type:complete len:213 (+) Transcript_16112:647-1285(+)
MLRANPGSSCLNNLHALSPTTTRSAGQIRASKRFAGKLKRSDAVLPKSSWAPLRFGARCILGGGGEGVVLTGSEAASAESGASEAEGAATIGGVSLRSLSGTLSILRSFISSRPLILSRATASSRRSSCCASSRASSAVLTPSDASADARPDIPFCTSIATRSASTRLRRARRALSIFLSFISSRVLGRSCATTLSMNSSSSASSITSSSVV